MGKYIRLSNAIRLKAEQNKLTAAGREREEGDDEKRTRNRTTIKSNGF